MAKRKRLQRAPNRIGGDRRSWQPEPKPRPGLRERPSKAQIARLIRHFKPTGRNR